MHMFYLGEKNPVLIYIFHVRASFRNSKKPENFLEPYFLMTYLGFDFKIGEREEER